MQRIMIIVILTVLLSILFAEGLPQKTENYYPLESEISVTKNLILTSRNRPEWEWQYLPQSIVTNYADYFQTYYQTPVALQPEEHGGGVYIIYRVKNQAGESEIWWSYIDSEGEIQQSNSLDCVGYYPDAATDPGTGDVFGTWHYNVTDGSNTYDCILIYDLYHIVQGCGSWKDPEITILDSDVQNYLDPTENDEFIWPIMAIGPSPDPEKRRIYIVARNHENTDGIQATISENALLMYADFAEDDLSIQSDLEWSYTSIPQLDNWNAEDPAWYRPFYSFTVIDNQVIFMGYRITNEYANDPEDKLFCFINDNYGEGDDWNYNYQSWEPEEVNPSWIDPGTGNITHLYPSDINHKIMHTTHFNVVPTHDKTRVTFAGAVGITYDDGYYYPAWFQIYPKTFSFDLETEEFSFCDVYPQGADACDDIPMKPWDLDEDGEFDEIDENGRPLWAMDWPIFHYDYDSAFHYNEYFLSTNEEKGWMAYLWVDGMKSTAANEGISGYEDWFAKPELAIVVSNDWGDSWSDPIFMNANEDSDDFVPELTGMIPCFAYPGDRIEDDGAGYGIMHLFFIDDYDFGSYHSQQHGLNNGSMFEYAAMRIYFGENINYGDIDDNGEVEAYDASLVLMHSIGMATPYDPIDIIIADVDGSNDIDAYDAALILQYSVGIIEDFPIENRTFDIPFTEIMTTYQNGQLIITAAGELYSLELEFPFNIENRELKISDNFISACKENKLALAAAFPCLGEILRLQMDKDEFDDLNISASINSHRIELGTGCPLSDNKISSIYPNPFNLETMISYNLGAESEVKLDIYNCRGQKVETLVNEKQSPGEYNIAWQAGNKASGVYFVRMITDSSTSQQKILLIK
ncbi:MAG: T9SS type A sorting domain-containing protein [Candidatus Cloacimonetes bacterium]|nr:T9SS type A sorting domain-containing protein [Candidatus Cloacimonadota bacterium]